MSLRTHVLHHHSSHSLILTHPSYNYSNSTHTHAQNAPLTPRSHHRRRQVRPSSPPPSPHNHQLTQPHQRPPRLRDKPLSLLPLPPLALRPASPRLHPPRDGLPPALAFHLYHQPRRPHRHHHRATLLLILRRPSSTHQQSPPGRRRRSPRLGSLPDPLRPPQRTLPHPGRPSGSHPPRALRSVTLRHRDPGLPHDSLRTFFVL